jgi:hypothetical protein
LRRWQELVINRGKGIGEVLFDRPKTTTNCSAKGRRRIRKSRSVYLLLLWTSCTLKQ